MAAPKGKSDERPGGGVNRGIVFLNGLEAVLCEAGLSTWPRIGSTGESPQPAGPRPEILPSLPDGRVPLLLRITAASQRVALRKAEAGCRSADLLRARDFPVPLPAALGSLPQQPDDPSRGRSFVLLLAPSPVVPLDRYLRMENESREAGEVASAAVRSLAALHEKGIRFGLLPAWNVMVSEGGGSLFVPFPVRAGNRRDNGSALRDLASLSATLESTVLSRSARLGLLRHYLSARRLAEEAANPGKAWRRISSEERRLRRAGVFPLAVDLEKKRSLGGRLVVDAERSAEMQRSGFVDPADFLSPGRRAEIVRSKEGRLNCRFSTSEGRYFLKIHGAAGSRGGKSPGRKEWEGFQKLFRFAIPTPPPVAWGETAGGSFFVSRDEGGVPLDDLLSGPEGREHRFRWKAARTAGRLVSLFHRAGFFHRDLYLCHLLVRGEGLTFIDLQRLEDGYLFVTRGRIKDLAALYHSSVPTAATRTDRLRFLRAYRGGGRLGKGDRRLVAAVLRKAAKIARHVEKGRARALRRGGES